MKPLPTSSEIDNIKTRLSEFYERIKHLDQSYNNLDRKRLKFIENRCVLNSLNEFHRSNLVGGGYDDEHTEDTDYDDNAALLNEQRNHSLEIGYEAHNLDDISFNSLAGTIARDKVPILKIYCGEFYVGIYIFMILLLMTNSCHRVVHGPSS